MMIRDAYAFFAISGQGGANIGFSIFVPRGQTRMSDNSSDGTPRPVTFGRRGAMQQRAEKPLPGTSYAAPADPEAASRRKRSVGISLAFAGVGAIAWYAYERRQECLRQHPDNPDACRSSSRSGTTSGSSRYFGSSGTSSGTNRVVQSTTSRGGFGSFFRSGGG